MKHHEHHPEVKFGLKYLLILKLNQKAGGMCWWPNLASLEKQTIRFPILDCPVLAVSEQSQGRSQIQRFEDPRCFEARKGAKRHQVTEIEENQVRSRSRKNRTIRFAKPEYPVFWEHRVRVGFEI
jgi:hypothetical protein